MSRKKVAAIPRGYRTATPCLTVKGVELAIDFYQKAFGATIVSRTYDPTETTLFHATIKIGNSLISLNQETSALGIFSPATLGNNGSQIHLYVENVDKVWADAIEAGAKEVWPLNDAYWGDRVGTLIDPYGHKWSLASRVEHVSQDQIQKRSAAIFGAKDDSLDLQSNVT
jgi:PhnB protein